MHYFIQNSLCLSFCTLSFLKQTHIKLESLLKTEREEKWNNSYKVQSKLPRRWNAKRALGLLKAWKDIPEELCQVHSCQKGASQLCKHRHLEPFKKCQYCVGISDGPCPYLQLHADVTAMTALFEGHQEPVLEQLSPTQSICHEIKDSSDSFFKQALEWKVAFAKYWFYPLN